MERILAPKNRLPLLVVTLIVSIHSLEIGLHPYMERKAVMTSGSLIQSTKRAFSSFDGFPHLRDFQFIEFGFPSSAFASSEKKDKEKAKESKKGEQAQVPPETRDKFIPPKIKDPKARHEKYERKAPVGDLSSARFIVNEEPFFEGFDHEHTILALNSFRIDKHIPFLKLLSIRPFFPFFVKT